MTWLPTFGNFFPMRHSPRCVVYTCMFGFSEPFNDFRYDTGNLDFVCFTDDPELKSSFWTIRAVSRGLLDPSRAAKQVKALPHRFLAEYDWSLYVDNTVRLKISPKSIFDRFLAEASSPFVCFRHPQRDCVYEEAEEIIRYSYDDPARVRAQMRFYRHLGYPAKNGLATASFLLRRHHDAALVSVMERWYQQVLLYSLRDQLSLNPVMWFDRFSPTYLDRRFDDFELFDWPMIGHGGRVPRDFDDARYLDLNPDVTGDARRHYRTHGAAEGRRYK